MIEKILLIRFSSFGDVTQTLSVPTKLKKLNAEVHWATREDMSPLIQGHPWVDKIHTLDKRSGVSGLIKFILKLRAEKYSRIYDAHNNLRSHLICFFLRFPLDISRVFSQPKLVRTSQKRIKRFLLFNLRINTYKMPFSGQRDLLEPLTEWGIDDTLPPAPQIKIQDTSMKKIEAFLNDKNIKSFYALAPSAAFILKRWPVKHWIELIQKMPRENFVILGGPEDTFINEIAKSDPDRVFNLAGQCTLQDSAAVVFLSKALVSNDTGVLHLGEQLGKKTIALMGPAPFGFPSRPSTRILQRNLDCRPCSKHGQGPCKNKIFHECLESILPDEVCQQLTTMDEIEHV